MKLLDLRSFSIGVLLTTTIVIGIGATSSPLILSWEPNQQWEIKSSNGKNIPKGWEPFAYDANDNFDPLLLRRRIQ
jgi:hypothetical protein